MERDRETKKCLETGTERVRAGAAGAGVGETGRCFWSGSWWKELLQKQEVTLGWGSWVQGPNSGSQHIQVQVPAPSPV